MVRRVRPQPGLLPRVGGEFPEIFSRIAPMNPRLWSAAARRRFWTRRHVASSKSADLSAHSKGGGERAKAPGEGTGPTIAYTSRFMGREMVRPVVGGMGGRGGWMVDRKSSFAKAMEDRDVVSYEIRWAAVVPATLLVWVGVGWQGHGFEGRKRPCTRQGSWAGTSPPR